MTAAVAALVAALVALLHATPAAVLPVARAAVEAAAATGASECDLAAVAVLESRAGTDPRAASPFGVRVDHHYIRDASRSALLYARAYVARVHRCGSRGLALASLRGDGGCRETTHRDYATRALGVAARLCHH